MHGRVRGWSLWVAGAAIAAVGLVEPGAARADRLPDAADEVVHYTIAVTLDASSHKLDGRERLVWRNPSSDTRVGVVVPSVPQRVQELEEHVLPGVRWPVARRPDGEGRLGLDRHHVDQGRLTARPQGRRVRFEHPDDDNADDQTVARVSLPTPVPAGRRASSSTSRSRRSCRACSRAPATRTTFHLVGQWFPKVGGLRAGGHARTRHRRVELRTSSTPTPSSTRTSAATTCRSPCPTATSSAPPGSGPPSGGPTGRSLTPTSERNVHDFAWTADKHYLEIRRTFSATKDVSAEEYARIAQLLGRTEDEVRLKDVEILVLLQPHAPATGRQARAGGGRGVEVVRAVVRSVSLRHADGGRPGPRRWRRRRHGVPDVHHGRHDATYFNRWPFDRINAPEEVDRPRVRSPGPGTAWWPATSSRRRGSTRASTTYSTDRAINRGYGEGTTLIQFLGLSLTTEQTWRMQNTFQGTFDKVRQPAWTYGAGGYSFYSYTKPGLLLRTLEHHLGEQTMARVMRTYHERWRFKHPTSEDFYAVANEVSGQGPRVVLRAGRRGDRVARLRGRAGEQRAHAGVARVLRRGVRQDAGVGRRRGQGRQGREGPAATPARSS